MRVLLVSWLRVAFAAVGALAPAAAAAQVGVAREAIVGGTPSAYQDVVALVDDEGTVFCSGTLVSAERVLTAAHCLDQGEPSAVIFVAPGAPRSVSVAASVVHPDYDPRSLAGDLALLWLASPVPEVTPRALHREPLDESWIGRSVRVVGFGLDSEGAIVADGAQRERLTPIEAIEPERLRHGPASCDGDSGGAALDQAGVLIAVVSSGPRGCRFYGRATRVDVALTWIDTAEAAPRSDGCAAGGRGGSQHAVWAIALGLALRRRRAQRHGRRV